MDKEKIYHGSQIIIRKPSLEKGKKNNDFGQGFYLTEDKELAKEWTCSKETDGFVNEYEIDYSNLNVLDLTEEEDGALLWVALLLKNRILPIKSETAMDSAKFILEKYFPDLDDIDVIRGYRADNTCFDYAKAFINDMLSVEKLADVLLYDETGLQTVLISKRAFDSLEYISTKPVKASAYYDEYCQRDTMARSDYKAELREQAEGETLCSELMERR